MAEDDSIAVTTLPKLVLEESCLFDTAYDRIGWPFAMAQESTLLVSTFIASVSADRDVFIRCVALLKKHHTLAFLSVVRRHHIQAMLNLRVVIEAISNAAFALANPDADYIDADTGLAMDAQAANVRSYKWVTREFPDHSADLQGVKDDLSAQTSHFNLVQSGRIVSQDEEKRQWNTGFFDEEDDHLTKIDLWLVAQTAIAAMHLIEQVRDRFGGYVVAAQFNSRANIVAEDCNRLRSEMVATERHQRATGAAADAEARKSAAKAARRAGERRTGKQTL